MRGCRDQQGKISNTCFEKGSQSKIKLIMGSKDSCPSQYGWHPRAKTARGSAEAQVAFSKHCSHPGACCCYRTQQHTGTPKMHCTCRLVAHSRGICLRPKIKSVTRSTNCTVKAITNTIITSTYLKFHLKQQVLKNLMSCPLLAIKAELSFFTNFVKLSLLSYFSSV